MTAAKILVVDDDPDFVEIARTVLLKHGYQVLTAPSGAQALDLMRQDKPDVVILDVMMRGATEGYQVGQMMHDDAQLHDVPVLIVSSIMNSQFADQFPTDEYFSASDFIQKPVDPKKLIQCIDSLLRK